MRTTQPLTITLPPEMARMVKDKVASGEYASESEVVRDGLRTLAARDAAVDRWLRDEVADRLAQMQVDPGKGIPAQDVFARLQKRHEARRADEE